MNERFYVSVNAQVVRFVYNLRRLNFYVRWFCAFSLLCVIKTWAAYYVNLQECREEMVVC